MQTHPENTSGDNGRVAKSSGPQYPPSHSPPIPQPPTPDQETAEPKDNRHPLALAARPILALHPLPQPSTVAHLANTMSFHSSPAPSQSLSKSLERFDTASPPHTTLPHLLELFKGELGEGAGSKSQNRCQDW